MYKFCNSCKTEKNIDDFNFKNISKQTRQSKCKDCQKIASNNHYKNNSEKYITAASEKKKQIRDWWQDYKKQFKCACGESHPACIDFHHPENNKEKDVSAFFNEGAINKGLEELKKCIPICSNCHRKLHYELREKRAMGVEPT